VYSKRGLTDGFRRIDKDNKGTITADEIMSFFAENAHKPYYVNERTIGVLVDWADINGDDAISCNELSQVLRCEDLLELSELVPDKKMVCAEKREGERVVCERGAPPPPAARAPAPAAPAHSLPGARGRAHGGRGAKGADDRRRAIPRALPRRAAGALPPPPPLLLFSSHSLSSPVQALAFIDADGSGWLSRDEFKGYLKSMNVLTYKDKKTNRVMKGPLSVKEVDGMLDVVDVISAALGGPGDGERIDSNAMARIMEKDENGHLIDILTIAGI